MSKPNPNQDVIETLAAIRRNGNPVATAAAEAIIVADAIAALRPRAQVGNEKAQALLDEARQLGIEA